VSETIRSPNAHRTFWKSLADKAYRHAYAAAHVGDYLAMQIHSMRLRRNWTQGQLATESGNTQPRISNLETSCEGVTLTTLHKIAEAFDVALVVKFVPFSQLAKETMNSRAEAAVPGFDEDSLEAISHPTVRVLEPSTARRSARGGIEAAYVRRFATTGSGNSAATL
jgi:transcriptional regulator with XRE-family HTH domain